jgi:L-lactate dehydrogenase complex protein LldE
MRVALFLTCFNDAMYPGTGKAIVSLLERVGHVVPGGRSEQPGGSS